MTRQNGLVTWLAIGIIALGIVAIIAMTVQSAPEPEALPTKVPVPLTPTLVPPTSTPTIIPTVALPTPTFTPLPLNLPKIDPPAGGQIYTVSPRQGSAVGWVRSTDGDGVNHFGDFNIYAGIFDGQVHAGAIQFDLTGIAPGIPILHADLTLMGQDGKFVAPGGEWRVQMLEPWIDQGWETRDFHWLTREDSGSAPLMFDVTSADLARGKPNTFFFSPEGLALLEARLYSGSVSFRVLGPNQGEDNLFAWDSGFGAGSLGRAPVLRIVAGPQPEVIPPSPTPKLVIIPPESNESLLAQAAERMTATAQAVPYTGEGTPTPMPSATPLPPNWVTPVIVVDTPTPENAVTAVWQAQIATAQAIVIGTPTPLPPNIWTATPTPGPTATRDLILVTDLTATPTPTVTPTGIPPVLKGKILFLSDRLGNAEGDLMVMDPDGGNVALWAAGSTDWIYQQAKQNQDISPDGQYRVVVSEYEIDSFPDHKLDSYQLYVVPTANGGKPQQLSQLTELKAMSYDAVWSPTDYRIAFVSAGPGNDELYTIRPDGSELTRLTFNTWEWDKHPSWSPDGSKLVFWSNRDTARKQIWSMNADGSDQRNVSSSEFNDWDPVWVK